MFSNSESKFLTSIGYDLETKHGQIDWLPGDGHCPKLNCRNSY